MKNISGTYNFYDKPTIIHCIIIYCSNRKNKRIEKKARSVHCSVEKQKNVHVVVIAENVLLIFRSGYYLDF